MALSPTYKNLGEMHQIGTMASTANRMPYYLLLRSTVVSVKAKYASLAKIKQTLAEKCERQAKICKSKPRQKVLKRQARRFRRLAEQCARIS
ncbi:MAG: hypothetical protein ACWGMZ_12485 [Thermoguttaceae bacterium]